MVDAIRLKALTFFGADPTHFDLVFVANATAAVKLVADAFRDMAEQSRSGGFWYGYHREAHTSLVGVRELAGEEGRGGARCFGGDGEVEAWLRGEGEEEDDDGEEEGPRRGGGLGLFAYPAQSNLTGRRLPLDWPRRVRYSSSGGRRRGGGLKNTYTLVDAAALAMTSPLDHVFRDADAAPDFVCVSFYKIFGFPDLGGLVVRKESGHVLTLRKYFGGGTVSLVSTVGSRPWHMSKGLPSENVGDGSGSGSGVASSSPRTSSGTTTAGSGASTNPTTVGGSSSEGHEGGHVGGGGGGGLHEGLEDGTLPFHNILALGEAMDVHRELYGSMENISRHTTQLSQRLFEGVSSLRYANGQPLVKVYYGGGQDDDANHNDEGKGRRSKRLPAPPPPYGDANRQGPTLAFNLFRADGTYESYAAVEKTANDRGFYVRSGG